MKRAGRMFLKNGVHIYLSPTRHQFVTVTEPVHCVSSLVVSPSTQAPRPRRPTPELSHLKLVVPATLSKACKSPASFMNLSYLGNLLLKVSFAFVYTVCSFPHITTFLPRTVEEL